MPSRITKEEATMKNLYRIYVASGGWSHGVSDVAERTVEQAEDLTLRHCPPSEILTNRIFVFSLMILRSSSTRISLLPTHFAGAVQIPFRCTQE
jgi:hypothetical protein